MLELAGNTLDEKNLPLIEQIPCQFLTAAVAVGLVLPFEGTFTSGTYAVADFRLTVETDLRYFLCFCFPVNDETYALFLAGAGCFVFFHIGNMMPGE